MKNLLRYQGFSLIELILTLTLFSILLTISIPNLNTYLLKKNVAIIKNDLTKATSFASNIALILQKNVQIVPIHSWSYGIKITTKDEVLHSFIWNFHNINISWKGRDLNTIDFAPVLAKRMSNGTFIINNSCQVIMNKLGYITKS